MRGEYQLYITVGNVRVYLVCKLIRCIIKASVLFCKEAMQPLFIF